MFTVGWDIDRQLVRSRELAAATVSIASILIPFALGLALAVHLHPSHDVVDGQPVPFWPFALFVGAALSVTAFPVLARILQDAGLSATQLGVLVLSAAAFDDLIGWTALAIALAALASGGIWDYARIFVETGLFIGFIFLVGRPLLRALLVRASPVPAAVVVPAALGGAYVTEAIGIHAVFGAFLVGAAMPRSRSGALLELRRGLSPVIGVLAPIYFVTSGMAVDIPGLRAEDTATLVLVLVAASAGKFLGAFGGARVARVDVRNSAAIGVLMNTRGLIEIVLLTIGRDRGLIDDQLFTILALMALATTLLPAPLLRMINPLPAERLRAPPTPARAKR